MQPQLVFNITHILNAVSLFIGFAELWFLRTTFKNVLSAKKNLLLNVFLVMGLLSLPLSLVLPYGLGLTLVAVTGLLYVFDGAYNGGSDYMNFLVTFCLTLSVFSDSEKVKMGALLYIGAQAILSYFVAGFAKLLKPKWRSGESLKKIIEQSHYLISREWVKKQVPYFILSWLVIGAELGIFLGFLNFDVGLFLMAVFMVFHLVNIQLLKLNRFLFAWLSSYACVALCFYQAI